jgi:hypothetical protein
MFLSCRVCSILIHKWQAFYLFSHLWQFPSHYSTGHSWIPEKNDGLQVRMVAVKDWIEATQKAGSAILSKLWTLTSRPDEQLSASQEQQHSTDLVSSPLFFFTLGIVITWQTQTSSEQNLKRIHLAKDSVQWRAVVPWGTTKRWAFRD